MIVDGYYHDVTITETPEGLTVEGGGDPILISPELYDRACAGEYPQVRAGEGLLAIHALNGTFRWRLTGDTERYSRALVATRLFGDAFEKDRYLD